jgi:hypothetical protein
VLKIRSTAELPRYCAEQDRNHRHKPEHEGKADADNEISIVSIPDAACFSPHSGVSPGQGFGFSGLPERLVCPV